MEQEVNQTQENDQNIQDNQNSTITYTSADKKLNVKLTGGHIVTCILSFLTGFASGVYAMSKYTINKK